MRQAGRGHGEVLSRENFVRFWCCRPHSAVGAAFGASSRPGAPEFGSGEPMAPSAVPVPSFGVRAGGTAAAPCWGRAAPQHRICRNSGGFAPNRLVQGVPGPWGLLAGSAVSPCCWNLGENGAGSQHRVPLAPVGPSSCLDPREPRCLRGLVPTQAVPVTACPQPCQGWLSGVPWASATSRGPLGTLGVPVLWCWCHFWGGPTDHRLQPSFPITVSDVAIPEII